MPVHNAADCRAQQCHHHQPPLEPRDVPPPANGSEHPPHEIDRQEGR